jgi:hypothetical protein
MASLMPEGAVSGDVEALVSLRDDAARWLLDRVLEQWQPGEFGVDRMRAGVEQGHVHVLREHGRLKNWRRFPTPCVARRSRVRNR